ncbi:hypothetical protein Nepgr_033339 [Nepenthes gracilis]|uniref:11-beta-hydroxysteroid dehydrogenase-like 4A n=1 Tax=Nepenthes gracilis TaxID=150966 RepID=A0AAD3TLS7_NEPGR|nr:hypothetical protein Nepgr_033339 [Nepenthes gracilis]
METTHMLLNLASVPLTLVVLFFMMPPYFVWKFLCFVSCSAFCEDLVGKVVIITGASSGIGEHIAYEYARRGARLALAARRENRLQEVADKAMKLGSPDVVVIFADVSKVDHCQRIVDETVNHFGRGVVSINPLEVISDITDIKPIMEINFWGCVYTTKFAIPHLKKSKGKIIAIASSAHWMHTPGMSLYNATKAAMVGFLETLRIELGSSVKITIVAPGFVESEMTQGKCLSNGSKLIVDKEPINFLARTKIPICKVGCSAKAIVDSASRGDRYLTEPPWLKAFYLLKLFNPDLSYWVQRRVFVEQYKKII